METPCPEIPQGIADWIQMMRKEEYHESIIIYLAIVESDEFENEEHDEYQYMNKEVSDYIQWGVTDMLKFIDAVRYGYTIKEV